LRQSSKGDWHASWAAMRAYLQFDGQQNKSTLPLLSLATTPGYSLATALPCHCSPLPLLPSHFSLATALPCHCSPLPLLYLATALPCHYSWVFPCHCSTLPLLSLATTPGYSLATALPCHYSRPIFLPFLFSPLPLLSLATTPGYSRGPHKSDPSVRLANKMAHPSAHVQAEVDHHSLVTILSALYAQDQRFASRTPRRSGHSLRICSKKCQP